MTSLHEITSEFVANVAFDSATLHSAGGVPLNWYWYGSVEGGPALELNAPREQVTPPSQFPKAVAAIGWRSGRAGEAPYVGTVTPSEGAAHFVAVTDCSGFVAYLLDSAGAYDSYFAYVTLLKNALPALRKIDARHTAKWPSAADFAFAAFEGAPQLQAPWLLVDDVGTAQPGDLLAWGLLPTGNESDTGHVMVIDTPPVQTAAQTWTMRVFDASILVHQDDTRTNGRSGVGAGTVGVKQQGGTWQISFQPATEQTWPLVQTLAVLRFTG